MLVLAMIGVDRPGLVDRVSGVVAELGGNWERSHMVRLGGSFAGVVEIVVPDAQFDDLRTALERLDGAEGLRLLAVDGDAGSGDVDVPRRSVVVSVTGTDRPGLLHAVSAAFATTGANIEQLTSSTTTAPMSGDPLFVASATVSLPDGLAPDDLRAPLEALADHLMVDIELIS